jgi:hypothetical protein
MSDWSYKIARPASRVWKHPAGYLEGSVITADGIVYVYSQGGVSDGNTESDATNLQIVVGGRLYSRSIAKRYTQRGLVMVANRFAAEIAGEQLP